MIAFHLQPVAQKQAHHSNGVFCGEFVSHRRFFYLELNGVAIKYGGTSSTGDLPVLYSKQFLPWKNYTYFLCLPVDEGSNPVSV